LVSASELASLQSFTKTASIEQLRAIRKTYADAFNTDMKVAAVVSGVAVVATLVTWRREKVDVQGRHRDRVVEEERRRRRRAEMQAKGTNGGV
jgi:hypothetical protein